MFSHGMEEKQRNSLQVFSSPELSEVVVPRLAVCGARDADGETWLELPELQQDDGQVVDEEQSVHQGDRVLHNALVVLVLREQTWLTFNQIINV